MANVAVTGVIYTCSTKNKLVICVTCVVKSETAIKKMTNRLAVLDRKLAFFFSCADSTLQVCILSNEKCGWSTDQDHLEDTGGVFFTCLQNYSIL